MKTAIVTIATGKHYDVWEKVSRHNWVHYTRKIDATLFRFSRPFDPSPRAAGRSIAWQKLLVFSLKELQDFDAVCWMDSDIIINYESAPSIFEGFDPDTIGITRHHYVDGNRLFSIAVERRRKFYESLQEQAGGKHDSPFLPFGISERHPTDFNTGVILANPRKFGEFFKGVYDKYEDAGRPEYNYEQWPLVHELISNNLYSEIDPKFNVIWLDYALILCGFIRLPVFDEKERSKMFREAVRWAYANSYFLHFAGAMKELIQFSEEHV